MKSKLHICLFPFYLATFSLTTLASYCSAQTASENLNDTTQETKSHKELVVDAVVASVNDVAITLSELGKRFNTQQPISLRAASRDPQALQILDEVIAEHLIEAEAKLQRIEVSQEDIETYLEQVAARNSISKKQLIEELEKENVNFEVYKTRIRQDILKSRLTGSLVRDGAGVSDEEVEEYKQKNYDSSKTGDRLKLKQILIRYGDDSAPLSQARTQEQARSKIEELEARLEQGENFSQLAAQFSESPEAQEGGNLGIIAVDDLSKIISDAVLSLQIGEISEIVKSKQAFHIFQLEKRFENNGGDQASIDQEVRQILEEEKLQAKIDNYFNVELYNKHNVDKKI